jgi:hypothetical protein
MRRLGCASWQEDSGLVVNASEMSAREQHHIRNARHATGNRTCNAPKRHAQEPKPRGRPPKKKSNRGRKPKSNVQERFGDSLYVTAYVDLGGKKGEDDGDKLAAQSPVPLPASRPRGRPPKQRPDAGGRQTAESSPALSTRLPTRHTQQGSELAPPPKRPKPLHDAASFLIPLAVPRGGTGMILQETGGRMKKEEEREDDEEEESAV